MARPDSGIEWLLIRLSSMADDVAWAVRQVPEARLDISPPGGDSGPLGAWPAHRHLYHLQYGLRNLFVPSFRWFADASQPYAAEAVLHWKPGLPWPEGRDYDTSIPVAALVEQLRGGFAELVHTARSLDTAQWAALRPRPFFYGQEPEITPAWLLKMIYQHTCDHINTVMRIALFWDAVAAQAGAAGDAEQRPQRRD